MTILTTMTDVPAELYIIAGGTLIAVVLILIWLDPTTRRKK